MLPYNLLIVPIPIFLIILLSFFGFYFLMNIIVCLIKRNIKWKKYILYIADGFIVFFAIICTIYIIILGVGNPDSSFSFLFFIITGELIFFGLMGLFFTYYDTKFVDTSGVNNSILLKRGVILTKRTVIIKIIYLILIMFPYIIFIEPPAIWGVLFFIGGYFLINIIAFIIKRNIKWIKYILYILDGFIVFSVIIGFMCYIITLQKNEEANDYGYFIFLIMGVFIYFGLMGLFLTYCDTDFDGHARVTDTMI
jgi:hypothetical protein